MISSPVDPGETQLPSELQDFIVPPAKGFSTLSYGPCSPGGCPVARQVTSVIPQVIWEKLPGDKSRLKSCRVRTGVFEAPEQTNWRFFKFMEDISGLLTMLVIIVGTAKRISMRCSSSFFMRRLISFAKNKNVCIPRRIERNVFRVNPATCALSRVTGILTG